MPGILVLGGGMVGSVIAADLVQGGTETPAPAVRVADRSEAALERVARRTAGRAQSVRADLSDPAEVARLSRGADVVVGALASHLGLAALEAVIDTGRSAVDISFMAEDARTLSARAKSRGATVYTDFGVAPGMSNLLSAVAAGELDRPERLEIMVGGLPVERRHPFQYKAGFAPADVIEEYVRPARLVEGGRIVVREALSGVEPVDFPGVGTLEAFNTDGLRTLCDTLEIPFMRERTLRYPGHADLMRAFRTAGLFSTMPVEVGGAPVVPRDVLAALLFPQWTYDEGEADLTVMRIDVDGRRGGTPHMIRYDLVDRFDAATGFSSMARTTGFPCAAVALELLAGRLQNPGVHPPEALAGDHVFVERLLARLASRGVCFTRTERC